MGNYQQITTLTQVEAIAAAFKIRASATLDICAGEIGLTDKQTDELTILIQRNADFCAGIPKVKPLTDIMTAKVRALIEKRDNPELPDGAKTYCKKWLNEYLFHRRKGIKSKYIDKGNTEEEAGFTIMAVELGLGMVYKNTQYHSNEYATGTDDLFVKQVVYDNKCSYELDTFPMWETEIPDEKYVWQINTYEALRGVEDGVLAYTLIDCPFDLLEREVKWLSSPNDIYKRICELVYTENYFKECVEKLCPLATFDYFVEIPQADRIRAFEVKYDPTKTECAKQRVTMCRAFIKELLIKKYLKN